MAAGGCWQEEVALGIQGQLGVIWKSKRSGASGRTGGVRVRKTGVRGVKKSEKSRNRWLSQAR